MYTARYFDESFIAECLEGFLYGFYSGIFILFLHVQYPSKDSKQSRTAIILFYAVCLLYVLSTFVIIGDSLVFVRETRSKMLSPQTIPKSQLLHFLVAQTTVNGCCDFIAQCIIIYRCWLVWGQNIYVVIIPSFLAIAYLATWLAPFGSLVFVHPSGQFVITSWGVTLTVTALAISMAVNALVTGLIVFKISKVFLEVEATSIDRTLGFTGNTNLKLRHIIFIIIESGMALFAIQVVRVVLTSLPNSAAVNNGLNFVVVIHRMFNGITPTIIFVRVSMKLSFDDTESFKETAESLYFQSNPNLNTFQQMGSVPSHDSKDICE